MKNELKRACTFYLGSWWLPPMAVLMMSLVRWSYHCLFQQGIWNETPNAMLWISAVSLWLIFLLTLGWLVSFFWIAVNKHFKYLLLSSVAMLFVYFICFNCFFP